MKNKSITEAVARAREKNEIRTRNGSLAFLAIGTVISAAMVGEELATHFQLPWYLRIIETSFLVVFAYITIDSNARNNLLASSDQNGSIELKNYFQKKSIIALISTVLFSICASYFVGQISKGKSPYEKFSTTVNTFSKRDSTNKALASSTLSTMTSTQKEDIKSIEETAKINEANLVNTFEGKKITRSWKEDYRIGKNNPTHYIWVCKTCPPKYKRWRNAIQTTRRNKTTQIAEIKNSNTKIKKDIAATLSYSLQSDSTLSAIQLHTNILESERQNRSLLITFILILLTVFAATGAYGSNNNLKKWRDENGQYIEDGDQLIFDVFEDFCMNIVRQFLGVIFGILRVIDKGLEKIGIDLYEIEGKSIAKFVTNDSDQPNQSDQSTSHNSRVVINAFGQNKPDQPQTLGRQDFPADRPMDDQLRPVGRTADQLATQPTDQPRPMPPTSSTNPPTLSEKVIEKQTKIIVNNVNIQDIKRNCKRYYLRSFFPSTDSEYQKRKSTNSPQKSTLEKNREKHLERVEELKEFSIEVIYIGEGKFRTIEFA